MCTYHYNNTNNDIYRTYKLEQMLIPSTKVIIYKTSNKKRQTHRQTGRQVSILEKISTEMKGTAEWTDEAYE